MMRLDDVRELKRSLTARRGLGGRGVGGMAQTLDPTAGGTAPATVFFGIVPDTGVTGQGYRLAVRTTDTDEATLAFVRALSERYGDDVEVRHVGKVSALNEPTGPTEPAEPTEPAAPEVTPEDLQKRLRPLVRGASVAHYKVTAGTIGAFVRLSEGAGGPEPEGATYVLSNNHVLGDSGRGTVGDDVMQPGPYDGGAAADVIGTLAVAAPLHTDSHNVVDGALAVLGEGIEVDLAGFDGALTGVAGGPDARETVTKIGRTTAITQGRITAVEVDSVPIGYEIGTLIFDDQIEIEGIDAAFSAGGDSGSLIYATPDKGRHEGIALLFAGSETGGSTGHGLTYANPLPAVLAALSATLVVPSEPTEPTVPTVPTVPSDPAVPPPLQG